MDPRRDQMRRTFDTVADTYEAARPDYPQELFDTVVAFAGLSPGARLLEIGSATGKATLPLLTRGYPVTCVELGPELAAVARVNLAGLPVAIHVAEFETWTTQERFDLVFCANAWHWIDPEVRYQRAHELLVPGGHLALWAAEHALPVGYDRFFAEIQDVYEALGEGRAAEWPPIPPEQMADDRAAIEATGLFEDVQVRRFLWDVQYTAEEYITVISTFSDHITMEPARRDILYSEVRRLIAQRPDGRIRRHWYSILHVARVTDT